LPDGFKEYLLASCPDEDTADKENTTWWAFDRIKNVPEEYEHEVLNAEISAHAGQYLFFADYCIWCWAWAISCTDDSNRGRVAIIGGSPDRFVADTFSEFKQRYLRDIRSVS